jgi:hypothetical protein
MAGGPPPFYLLYLYEETIVAYVKANEIFGPATAIAGRLNRARLGNLGDLT